MAVDAQISQISSLAQYAQQLGSFAESATENTTAFVNIMTEKLYELREMQKNAKNIQERVISERQKIFYEYAAAAQCGDPYLVRELRVALQEAEQKVRIANRNVSIINSQVNVAHGAVMAIIDKNKLFKNDVDQNVENGRKFLQKISMHLEQYKDNSAQI